VASAHAAVRAKVPPLTEDRPLYGDIAAEASLVSDGSLVRAAESRVGGLS